MPEQLLFLELNEINLESIAFYCERGLLPNFRELLTKHGWTTTSSETHYRDIEPWIQWVTAHTGMTLAEHQVFRLGDIVRHDLTQIWEVLEELGLKVGAISPMNAKHRLKSPAFFMPDLWTRTALTVGSRLRGLYTAISQAVNDNSQARLTLRSAAQLLLGLLSFARPKNYSTYLRLLASSGRAPWRRALFLDLLLADVFIAEVARTTPDFASLFVNAGAHIQHHYLYSAACYEGPQRNPEWYLRPNTDPILEAYVLYDRVVGSVRAAFPRARLMIATGLHQVPHGEVTYYWRLRDHARFLRRLEVSFVSVEPRMSRDFLVVCESPAEAAIAAQKLASAAAVDGTPLFEVDNRGTDLFVMLAYPREIGPRFVFHIGANEYAMSGEDVVFVALKNGEHSGVGYFLDTGKRLEAHRDGFELKNLPQRIKTALGLDGAGGSSETLGERPQSEVA
jgi:hypothetical protein